MAAVVLLVVVCAAVLVPAAVQSHGARRDAFVVSFEAGAGGEPDSHGRLSPQVQHRRRIGAGLLIAMAGTALAGLAPPLRILLAAHLFLDDVFLGYVAVLALMSDRRDRARRAALAPVATLDSGRPAQPVPTGTALRPPGRRRDLPAPGPLVDLPKVASAG